MAKIYKNCIIEEVGEAHVEGKYVFTENEELCKPPKNICVGQRVFIVDPSLIDNSNHHAQILCECIFAEFDPEFPRCNWYYFRTVNEEDQHLNTLPDEKFEGLYYKILEATSPYIILIP